MTPDRTVVEFLQDVLEATEAALSFVSGMDFDSFMRDRRTIFAAVRALEIIGEAAGRVPPDIRARFPKIPWRLMIGMRNRLIHDYARVNVPVVWQTIHEDLPPLQVSVGQALETLSEDDGTR